MTQCKICSEIFTSDKSLHAHLKKHNIYQAEYYCTHFPRYSKFYKKQIPFINKKEYFSIEFLNLQEFLDWEKSVSVETVKVKCLDMLKERIAEKEYIYAPFHNEIKTLSMPPINIYKKYFNSYNEACKQINIEPLFNKGLPKDFYSVDVDDKEILVDTREQDPLEFKNTKVEKLFIGDYLLNDGSYNYTYVDRKSESDFLGTLSSGFERFTREIEKAVALGSYLFVVIESDIRAIISNHKLYRRKTNLEYVFHNMRSLSHKYPRHVQFIFSGSREKSLDLIPRILIHGQKLWQVDLQYFIDYELGIRPSKTKKIELNIQ